MDISKLNSLVELYFKKAEEVEGKKPFLKWLKTDKPFYNWEDITQRIFKLTAKKVPAITPKRIKMPNDMKMNAQVTLDIDRFIDCPYWIAPKKTHIHVFAEQKATELALLFAISLCLTLEEVL